MFKTENILNAFFLNIDAQLRILHNQSNIIMHKEILFVCLAFFARPRKYLPVRHLDVETFLRMNTGTAGETR